MHTVVKEDDAYVCVDCLMAIVNGDTSGASEDWNESALAETQQRAAANHTHLVCGDSEKEKEFSATTCDGCGSRLAGSRSHCVWLRGLELPHVERSDFDDVLSSYIEAALWASIDDDGAPIDTRFDDDALANETRSRATDDIALFLEQIGDELPAVIVAYESTPLVYPWTQMLGHDLWLTRNGHGAGFWDRGLGDIGDKLTRMAEDFGTCDLYVGDDSRLYFS